MKKLSLLFCSICLLLSLGLTACGAKEVKITGISAGIGTDENPSIYNNSLWNNETIIENDYILQVNKDYIFCVSYSLAGSGSKMPILKAENVKLNYDDSVLDIGLPSDDRNNEIYYNLICKKSVVNTAVIVEVGDYTYTVIISTE